LDTLSQEFSAHGPDTPARAAEFDGCRRPSVKDSVIGVKSSYWLRDRGNGPCVRHSDLPAPTLLTTCTGWPSKPDRYDKNGRIRSNKRRKGSKKRRRYEHIRRDKDAGDVDDASILSVREVGVLQGFPIRIDGQQLVAL